jgi:beta-lactamase superfamily II metal-dependent hydrolase
VSITIEIFDVGHGGCASITAPNGNRLMVDCGHNNERPWWPSAHYTGLDIEELVVSNYDEDHVSDLHDLMKFTDISFIRHNSSVSAVDLVYLKMENGMGPGIERLQQWMESVEGKTSTESPNFGPMKVTYYYNSYPTDFDEENNLSVVTFIEWSDFRIVFPGDLEEKGWQKLLSNYAFCEELRHINVFVASHHGRKSGCCEEVFKICTPQIVVMSDRDKQFDSQETNSWYANRCEPRGVPYKGRTRYVFTTRYDGDIRIKVDPAAWIIEAQR